MLARIDDTKRIMGCLSQAFGPTASFVAFDALATPVPTACGVKRSNYSRFHTCFQQQKKVGERGTTAPAVQKCRSHAPRDWHSANRFAGRTTCVGLPSGLQEGGGLRDGLARCARWVYLMVFCDGLIAMAFLNDCVTSRESFAGRISHYMRPTENQFGMKRRGDAPCSPDNPENSLILQA